MLHCAVCFADYNVEYFGAYPPRYQFDCDEEFVKHGGTLDGKKPIDKM